MHPLFSDTQDGFVADRGTRNAIFVLRVLSKGSLQKQEDIFLCFVDYQKAFDRVKHNEVIHLLYDLDVDNKELGTIQHMSYFQSVEVRMGDELSKEITIEKGVRQGCVRSPDLFLL